MPEFPPKLIRPFTARLTHSLAVLLLAMMTIISCTQVAPQSSATTTATAATHPSSASGKTYTVATYNVRNFFDTYDNPYTKDEGTVAKSKTELEQLASAIKEINADILVLEEVEAGGILKHFNKEYLADMHYLYAVDTVTEDPRGITVAMLSRYPVTRVVSHRFAELVDGVGPRPSNQFARDFVRFDVRIAPGYDLSVFGVHLKSKLKTEGDPQSNAWRLREANRIAAILNEEEVSAHKDLFLITGDFNDTPDAASTVRILTSTTPPLVDTLAGVQPRITFKNERYQEAIDNIFISPAMKAQLVGKAQILDGGVFDTASDHRPVKATFRVP